VAAFLIFRLGEKARFYGDAAIGIVSAVGIAGGIIIASLAQGFNVDLFSYLFGSLLAISWAELYFLLILTVVGLAFIIYYYRPLFALAFDETAAKVLGVKVKFLNTVLLLLTALTVAAAVKAVGVMLVSALLILPAVTALQLAKNFKVTLFMAAGFAVLSVIFGLIVSLSYNLPAGASIVMVSFFLFLFSYLIAHLRK
jgi:zinc transport system permease protein